MKDIVVLAGSTPWSVLSLCKCAYNHNAKSYVVCVKNGWGQKYSKSRYVYKAFDTTEAKMNGFWEQFFNETQFNEKPILYVTNDYVCQIVETDRVFYEECFDLCMASSYIMESFIDKNRASVEAERHGLTVPYTKEIKSEADVDDICTSFSFPVIVKPVTFHDHFQAGFKTQICESDEQLKIFVSHYLAMGIQLQCQEYVIGEDKNCVFYQFYRDSSGNITECMGEKTLQTDGIMTIGTTKYDKELAEKCHTFLKSIDYVGIGGIEFKRNDGTLYFIEMSTRTEGFLPISDMAGVSLAEASYLSKNGISFYKSQQKEGIQYVVFMPLLTTKVKEGGWLCAVGTTIQKLLLSKAHFTGAFLDLCFAFKLDLGILG